MKLKTIDGEKISFNTSKIKLLDNVLLFVNEKNLDSFIKKNKLSECYKILYGFTNTDPFKKIYAQLLNEVSKKFRTKNFYYQKVPSFRIHPKGSKSVEYHNDIMYGHGKDVINVWIPLTNTNKHNSLWLSDIDSSNHLMKKFKNQKMGIEEANKMFKEFSKPQIIEYGNIMFFNTATMHGTKKNKSDSHRISFDFRILEKGKSSGAKSLNGLYQSYFKDNVIRKECIFYMYQRNPLMENCSHEVQREILSQYAKKNSYYNIIEETEIHQVDHYPNLMYYIEKSKIKDILITSILCLPAKKDIRLDVLKLSKKNNKNLHFALENVSNNKSVKWINAYYEAILKKF